MASDDTESMHSGPDAPSSVAHGHKSYKRKFAKLKVKFEGAMKASNALVKEELRIVDLARRLKEQNDQILEILLEMNDSIYIPPHLRYKLSIPGDPLPALQEPEHATGFPCDVDTARQRLHEARERLLAGKISAESCKQLEDSLRQTQFAPSVKFASLLEIPHTENAEHPVTEDDLDATLGFLSPEHQAEYPSVMDSSGGFIPRASERRSSHDRDRETSFRNPVSVYNWLKKHQPGAFPHDGEPVSEKQPSRAAGTRASKRATAQASRDEEPYEEGGTLLEVPTAAATTSTTGGGAGGAGGGGRSKRKRDEDGGYRPKGGSSGRSRRKKDEPAAKRTKRPSAAGSTA